jgi:hypothetical protein
VKKKLLAVSMGAMMIPGSGELTTVRPLTKNYLYHIHCKLPDGTEHDRTAHGASGYMPWHAVRDFLSLCCPDYTLLSDFGGDAEEKGILFKAWCHQPEHTMDVYCKEIV